MSSSAKRALRILQFVSDAAHPPGVTDIARALSLAPASVFRSLDALARADLVSRYQSSSRYVLGAAADRLCQSLIARFRIRELSLPYLRQLASVSAESTSLHVRLGWYSVRIASATGMTEVTNTPVVGEARLLGGSYAGKAILAFLSDGEIARYRGWVQAHDMVWPEGDRDLRSVRRSGVALGKAEFGVTGKPLAFPIMVHNMAIAALSIDGPVLEGTPDPHSSPYCDWREIVGQLEHLAQAQPALFENPFAHLDPDTIMF
jgi:IclR family transcriptional regulator, acetate operon repressor